MNYCNNCGKPMDDFVQFCTNCGAKMGQVINNVEANPTVASNDAAFSTPLYTRKDSEPQQNKGRGCLTALLWVFFLPIMAIIAIIKSKKMKTPVKAILITLVVLFTISFGVAGQSKNDLSTAKATTTLSAQKSTTTQPSVTQELAVQTATQATTIPTTIQSTTTYATTQPTTMKTTTQPTTTAKATTTVDRKTYLRNSVMLITTHSMIGPDSAGGFEFDIDVQNKSNKTVKYVRFQIYVFNRVDDVISNEVGISLDPSIWFQLVGPVAPNAIGGKGEKFSGFYNSNGAKWNIKQMLIEYTDGEIVKLNSDEVNMIEK